MIVVKLKGGLGNQMFQYAFGRALAERNNTGLLLDITALNHRLPGRKYVFRNYSLDIFNVKQKFTFLSKLSKYLNNFIFIITLLKYKLIKKLLPKRVVLEKKEYTFEEYNIIHLSKTYVDGYWQHVYYFKSIEKIIREEFTFKNPISLKSKSLLEEIKSKNSVCVHIRKGDYVSIDLNSQKFNILGARYYELGIKFIKEKFSHFHLYIFSDDLEWCKKNINFGDVDHTFVTSEYEGEKMRDYLELMINCKHYIISNSTFSWWAAWLNNDPNKIVITPKKWINDDSVSVDGLILDNWIKI